jgi:hypothetical protein
MSLESKSQELKDLVAIYDTQWFLGDLSNLMHHIIGGRAFDQLGKLSSPLRQLYFVGGLLVSSDPANGKEIQYSEEEWEKIVELLNDIENEYDKIFFPKPDEEIDEKWKKVRQVAIPSFLSYFNQGPLNYEEQTINWVMDLFSHLDNIIEPAIGIRTEDFIQFYNNLDLLNQRNFQSYSGKYELLRPGWVKYTKIIMGPDPNVPDFIKEIGEKDRPLYTLTADHGIMDRFYPNELVSENLSIEKVQAILNMLTTTRSATDYLYYTATRPGNPLFEKPIIDIGDGMYQVFEVKQVIHATETLLENLCSQTDENMTKLVDKKGKLLESRIIELFKTFFKKDFEVYTGYFVDGCEQDILFLWKEYAFIIEAKGYKLNEPFRDPNKAFIRITRDFNECIGYGYSQANRVAQKFIDQVPLRIEDKNGNLVKEVDTKKYENNDFSIIVNLKSFGNIQNDLSTLLEIDEDCGYPWVVKFDDLEVFLLTLLAQKKAPSFFIDYLLMRENLHGKLICSDELEVCGGFISGKITDETIEKSESIITTPELAALFDTQYHKEMGFKNEKYLKEKRSGKYIFL